MVSGTKMINVKAYRNMNTWRQWKKWREVNQNITQLYGNGERCKNRQERINSKKSHRIRYLGLQFTVMVWHSISWLLKYCAESERGALLPFHIWVWNDPMTNCRQCWEGALWGGRRGEFPMGRRSGFFPKSSTWGLRLKVKAKLSVMALLTGACTGRSFVIDRPQCIYILLQKY